jgi:peptide/nickel transport system permease protein
MARYAVRRFGIFLLTIVVAITVNFVIIHATPADPVTAMLGRMMTRGSSVAGGAQIVEVYTKAFALDRPLYVQYLLYVRNLLMGDLGYSLAYFPQKVTSVVLRAIPWSAGLLLFSVLLAFVVGNLLGALAVWRRAPWFLQGLIYFFMTLSAMPFYLLALILLYLFAFHWPVFPIGGTFTVGSSREFGLETLLDFLRHATLPALSISLGLIGFWALSMRGVMATVMGEDYLTYARVKGLRERTIFLRYGMRNALLPQVTALAIDLGHLMSGQVLVETIFGYPGVGTVLYNALRTSDFFVVQGVVLFIIFAVALTMMLVDLAYPLLDPRVRYERAQR